MAADKAKRFLSDAISAIAVMEPNNDFLSASIGCLLARLLCLVAQFDPLSTAIDRRDAPSSCQGLTKGCLDVAEAS